MIDKANNREKYLKEVYSFKIEALETALIETKFKY